MNESVVVTHELSKRYGSRQAVDRVSLTVHAGEVYGFLGPNGAGKTTTLRMLLGLIRPTSGSATVRGHRPGSPGALTNLGALVESPGFYPYLSGRENLRILATYLGLATPEVDAVLELVELTDSAGERFNTYSLGMKQRLGVAAALLGEPELLILDEPTNGLDPAGMADMRALISTLAGAGHTVLLSSHLLGEVQQVCDRVGVIANGRLLTEGSVAHLRGTDALVIRAEPFAAAERLLGEWVGTDRVSVRDGAFRLLVDAGEAPALTAALVRADLAVHEVRPWERSLEEVFFELTGEERAA